MISRSDVLSQAIDQCMKELYSLVTPKVSWEEFKEENKIYSKKYEAWERFRYLYKKENLTKKEIQELSYFPGHWADSSITECIGLKPYEFYYLPKDIMKDICDFYIYAYNIDSQQELLNTISTLKHYCKEPIVDKYIDDWTDENGLHHPGYRSYDYPDNLQTELQKIIVKENPESDEQKLASDCISKFFEFLDMAGNFYNWNRDLNTFNMNVYLGPSPNSNKEAVIKNWKEYRNQDIEINEEQIKKDYYGEELD